MAGTAHSGWAAGTADLFAGAPWVLSVDDHVDPHVWAQVMHLALDCRAVIVPARSVEHDAAAAAISHLPHLLAEALAATAGEVPLAFALAAGSFRDGTRVAASAPDLRAFVTASAIWIYGPDRGDEVLTEDSQPGDGFLADVVAGWEDAAVPAARAGLRTVQVRTGLVQTPRGGVLRLLYPLFAAGLGGRLGSGKQWLAWIGLDDLLDIYLRAVLDPALSGPVNAVAPAPVPTL